MMTKEADKVKLGARVWVSGGLGGPGWDGEVQRIDRTLSGLVSHFVIKADKDKCTYRVERMYVHLEE